MSGDPSGEREGGAALGGSRADGWSSMCGPRTTKFTHWFERQMAKTIMVQKEGFSAYAGDKKGPYSAVAGELSELFA